ncbi:MAG: DUF4465 domain-containing protein [Prevotella sp.]|uniref:DUF4465 domain-containing protein n=1 Tax=Prevotella sp. TaxID=59823 RepID=UPI002A27FAED|nr:DUF4465 domain-containing protein [Prevotella sp.]MDD7317306.1 DUF4465 domain-containing protein [Prevotellaceae bacterium]MDY4019910.1 DUF4465 domain-containing protein [Prevotella sp.]
MKQQFLKLSLLLLTMLSGVPLEIMADRDIKQLQFGKQTIEVASDEEITFYDPWGTENIKGTSSYNSQSLTVFKPAEAGKSIIIKFEKIDLQQYSDRYFMYMNIYNGIADADGSFTFATKTSDINSSSSLDGLGGTLMEEKLSGTYTNRTYISTTADGALSVGFMHNNSKICEGWVAKVRSVKVEDMTVTGAGSDYNNVITELSTKTGINLAGAYVTTTGITNPDKVTSISFTLPENEGMVEPTALKLFYNDKPVDATVAADGEGYKFVFETTLSPETNKFDIRGDILGTAAVGAKVRLDVKKITTAAIPDGITPFTAGTPVTMTNPAIVIMTSAPQTVTVGETAMQFYDEGGKDGVIFSKTNGQVTFLSGVPGKKVKVKFNVNQIWHGTLYNQELRIYNGSEATPGNLISTLQKGELGEFSSTTTDGSLTVVLFSDASNDVKADGFEAEVSLFTPQAMVADNAETEAASTETLCGGDEKQPIMSVNVKTHNTEPALTAQKFAFSTNSTNANITHATLYYTGNKKEFSNSDAKKVGETDVTADAFEITTTATTVNLGEGDNYFWLAYNISDEAKDGQKVAAKFVKATFTDNTTATATTDNVAERTVENVVYSYADMGTKTNTVNGSLTFKTRSNKYNKYCEVGTDTRTNIFKPKHTGHVVQIDFTEFDVMYAPNSYGTRSVFKVINGSSASGEVLYELKSSDEQTTGPGKIIRSTSADGALTVVFNPNSDYSYTKKGWVSTVSEYISKTKEYSGADVTHTSTGIVSAGAKAQSLLTLNIKTEGDQGTLNLNAVTLDLKNTQANVSKVELFSVGKTDRDITDSDQAIATATVDGTASAVSMNVANPVELLEGDNFFRVLVDVSENAEAGQSIDAKLTSVKVNNEAKAVENGDPEGAREIKNIYFLKSGNNGEVKIKDGMTMMFYDDGGPEGPVSKNFEGTVTFVPESPADNIKLDFQYWKVVYTTKFYLYHGGEVKDKADKEIGMYDHPIEDGPITSLSEDGKITVKFTNKTSTPDGFAIAVSAYKKADVHVTNIETEAIAQPEVMKGETDVRMLKVAVTAEGEKASTDITGFTITGTDGEAVKAHHIYLTGMDDAFSANEEFKGSYTLKRFGTYYFWVAYDVKADAEAGKTATAKVTAITVGGQTINVNDPATATVTLKSGKHGTFTVGATGADYNTIQAAIDDIAAVGIDGPVVLNINAGEYNERVLIAGIKGLSANNTLTLQTTGGKRDVKIFHDKYSAGSGYDPDQYKKGYGVVTLFGSSYVTLKDLEISTTDVEYNAVVMVKNESRHVTIDNCWLHAPYEGADGNNKKSINIVGHYAEDVANRNNDFLTLKNSLIEGGYIGISMGGTSYVRLPKEVGGVIENNVFKNQNFKSIYSYDEVGVKILNNKIENTLTNKNGAQGIDITLRVASDRQTAVSGNRIYMAPSSYCYGINPRQLLGTAETPVLITNNEVIIDQASSYSAGIEITDQSQYVNIAHNSVKMLGGSGAALSFTKVMYGNVNVTNNVLQSMSKNCVYNFQNTDNFGKITLTNNIVYTNSTSQEIAQCGSSNKYNYEDWLTASGETGGYNKMVNFLDESVLEPENDLEGDLLKAVKLDYVTTDINGKARPEEKISIGAYEYDPNATSAPHFIEGYPEVKSSIDGQASVAIKSDISATAYYILKKSDEEAPTTEQLKESETKVTLVANTENILNFSNLEDDATYKVYFQLTSLRSIDGDAANVEFTMTVTPPAPEPPVIAASDDDVINEGETATMKAKLTSGTAPYTVTWMNAKRTVLKSETLAELPTTQLTCDVTPTECDDYVVKVVDANNLTATDTVRVIVTGTAQTATFENLYLDENSFWMGDLSKGIEGGSFVSGSYKFDNYASNMWGGAPTSPYWGNFAYANKTTTSFNAPDYFIDQWNNAVGGGYDGSENYMVAYPQGGKITVMNNEEGDILRGFYVTNDAWNVFAYTVDDGATKNHTTGLAQFGIGDWCKLTITADNGKTKEFYLADYRDASAENHYYIETWEWVDLRELGTVKDLSFRITSSRNNDWGMVTPAYFCLDNFNGTRADRVVDMVTVEGQKVIDLSEIFTLNASGTAVYTMPDGMPQDVEATVEFDAANGKITVSGSKEETFHLIVAVTQKGKTQYVKIPVTVMGTNGIRNIDGDSENMEVRYGVSGQRISGKQRGVQLQRMKDGTVRKVVVK